MKRLLLLLLSIIIVAVASSQTKKECKLLNGQLLYIVSTDGKTFGVEDANGKLIVPMESKSIYILGNMIYCEDVTGYPKKSDALYDWTGKCYLAHKTKYCFIKPKKVDNHWDICCYMSDGEYKIYDENGNCKHHLKSEKDQRGYYSLKDVDADTLIIKPGLYTDLSCEGDYLHVKYGRKEGILRLDGSTIIAPKRYGHVTSDGKYETLGFVAYLSPTGNRGFCGYYNKNGRCLFLPDKYTFISKMNNGLYRVRKDNKVVVVDSMDIIKIKTNYHDLIAKKNEKGEWFYSTALGNASGEMDKDGNIIKEPNPTEVRNKKNVNNFSYVEIMNTEGLHGINSTTGSVIIPAKYDKIVYSSKGHLGFILKKNGYEGFADLNGKIIIPCDKYAYVDASYKNCFIVEESGRMGLCNNNGVMTVNPLFDYILEYEGRINPEIGLMKGIIDEQGKVLVPFEYTSIFDDKDLKNFRVKLFDKKGVCDYNGNIIIPPIYTDVKAMEFFMAGDNLSTEGPFKYVFDVKDGEYQGIFTPDGKMLFPPTLFEHAFIGDGKYESDFKADWYICCFNDDDKDHQLFYDFSGNLLSERSSDSKEFYVCRNKAFNEFLKHNHSKTIEYCEQAVNMKKDGLCYLYMGVSYYHLNKMKDAIKAMDLCIQNSKSDYLTTEAQKIKDDCEQILDKRRQRRTQIWLGVLATALNVTATIVQTNSAIQSHNSMMRNTPKGNLQYSRDTSLDYLLDPRVAWMQVQQQEWSEYLQMTNGGKTMTLDQWRILKGQALMEAKNAENGIETSTDTSTSSSSSSSYSSRSSYDGPDCHFCVGLGSCKTCDGRGYYYNPYNLSKTVTCPNCWRGHPGLCSHCHGTGKK